MNPHQKSSSLNLLSADRNSILKPIKEFRDILSGRYSRLHSFIRKLDIRLLIGVIF